jgi:hypothetical protein
MNKQANGNANATQSTRNGAANGRTRKTSVSNSATIDAKNPIPIDHNGQLFHTTTGKAYIPFLNPKDNFAQLLTEAKLCSPTTLSCVSSKATYCVGKGWYIVDDDSDKEDPVVKDLTVWAASLNRKKQTLNDIIMSVLDNKFTLGNAFIEVVRGAVMGKRFVRVYVRSLLDCRLAEPDDDDICNSVYYSKQFRDSNWTFNATKVTQIPLHSWNMLDKPWWKDEMGNEHTMFHIKNEMAGYEYYGMPSNVASLPQQILEYKAARYNLDNYDNNLVIGGVVVLKGSITDEEAKKIGKDIVHTHTGDGKRGRFMILSSEAGALSEGADIKNFDTQKDGSYMELDTHTESKIYIANKWNKLLIGGTEQKSIGQGNSAYIRSVFDIANNTVIIPEQTALIEQFLKPLMRICDEWTGTRWSDLKIGIRPIQPVSFLGDIDVNAVITVNEGREIIGKKPIEGEKGDEFIKAGKQPDTQTPADAGGKGAQDV